MTHFPDLVQTHHRLVGLRDGGFLHHPAHKSVFTGLDNSKLALGSLTFLRSETRILTVDDPFKVYIHDRIPQHDDDVFFTVEKRPRHPDGMAQSHPARLVHILGIDARDNSAQRTTGSYPRGNQ